MSAASVTTAVAQLGARVRDARKTQKITQKALADYAGVSRGFVIELERGHERAEIGKVLAVLTALGIDTLTVGSEVTPQAFTPAMRRAALADITASWRDGHAPDQATQNIVQQYITGAISIDEALTHIDQLPALNQS